MLSAYELVLIDEAQRVKNIGLILKLIADLRLNTQVIVTGSSSLDMANEIKKGKKIYFYDNGIRNAILANFAPLQLRSDVGSLWENLMVSERIKRNSYASQYANLYFWRTHEQQEIDLIEEEDGMLRTFEFKWNPRTKSKLPRTFADSYSPALYEVVTPENFWDFIRI